MIVFFVTTNFISTKLKIQLQPMNVKGRYCLSFDDFECYHICKCHSWTFLTRKWRSYWCQWEYIDRNKTDMDTNEYLFSVNEHQKPSFSRRRSNHRAKMQGWAKNWGEVEGGGGGEGKGRRGGKKGIACSQSQTFYRSPKNQNMTKKKKKGNLSFLHNPTKIKIGMTESEESFDSPGSLSVLITSTKTNH